MKAMNNTFVALRCETRGNFPNYEHHGINKVMPYFSQQHYRE